MNMNIYGVFTADEIQDKVSIWLKNRQDCDFEFSFEAKYDYFAIEARRHRKFENVEN